MDDLAEKIKASLEDRNVDPWFPELTEELTAREWAGLHRDFGLRQHNYGTARVFARNISAPRHIAKSLKTSTSAPEPTISIEAVQPEWSGLYQKAGVRFYSPDEILNTTILSCIEDALVIIHHASSFMRTVVTLVRSLHVIRPENEDHDLSFSEPHVPFSIFVSVPEKRIASDALRVAEAIVHEAMHLQLTLIQHTVPLVIAKSEKYYSPWREGLSDSEGMLQALYVFSVINNFFQVLLAGANHIVDKETVRRRQTTVTRQIESIRAFQESVELTFTGRKFVRCLMQANARQFNDKILQTYPPSSFR